MKTVLFYDANLNERGTSVATYDYALYNEEHLGNRSIVVSLKTAHPKSYEKYKKRFNIYLFDAFEEFNKIECDFFYHLKYGFNDGLFHQNCKNLNHVVFPCYEPHGDVYAYISEWLAKNYGENVPFVPHMINLPQVKDNFRQFLNISPNKLVVGWYGGNNFEIPFARQAVLHIAEKRKDIVFLFMNQDPFCDLENVRFIDSTTNLDQKVGFINTCDIMIHARERGETFGLAIGEFSSLNKPIITYSKSPERNHIITLGDRGVYYDDYESLYNILSNIQKIDIEGKDWNCYQNYTPEKVMKQFKEVFLK